MKLNHSWRISCHVNIFWVSWYLVRFHGGVAQMVERPLSMREVPGSIPGISILFDILWKTIDLINLRLGPFYECIFYWIWITIYGLVVNRRFYSSSFSKNDAGNGLTIFDSASSNTVNPSWSALIRCGWISEDTSNKSAKLLLYSVTCSLTNSSLSSGLCSRL